METTTNLGLPYIMAAQSQKHITHNEALRGLDALVHLMVLDKDLAAPPSSPTESDRYIVAASPTGAWSGHSKKIAAFQDGAWEFYPPNEGWLAWIADENVLYAYDGAAWNVVTVGGASVNPVALVGVNATADTTNRLSVSSPATLLNHEGAGHQAKINKAAAVNTASLLFQTAFSGRAEMGTTGDDDFRFKVSPDGSAWHEAIRIDRSTGLVSFPSGAATGASGLIVNGDGAINQRAATSQADDTYAWDRHYVLTQSSAIGVSTLANVADGVPAMMRLTQSNASAQRMGVAHIVEERDSTVVRGGPVILSGKVRLSSSATVRFAILEWTGTADSPTSDVVSSWTNGTFTAGQFFISSNLTVAATGSLALSAATLADFSLSATVSSSCNNLILFLWTDATAAQNVTLDLRWKTEAGSVATGWHQRPLGSELALCQRHFEPCGVFAVGKATSSSNLQFPIGFKVPKRSSAIAVSLVAGLSNQIAEPGVASRTITAVGSPGTSSVSGMYLNSVTSSSLTSGAVHYAQGVDWVTASADL